jgi:nitrate/nitrite-specific signal transduction histidine kinase
MCAPEACAHSGRSATAILIRRNVVIRQFLLPTWARTIRFQVALSLGLMFAALAGSAGYGLYALDLRQHDYEILNLSGQLRVTSAAMISDARTFLRESSASSNSRRDRDVFHDRLQHHMALYDQIIKSFVARRLDPALTGKHDDLVCKWDPQSRSQLQRTADDWHVFRYELVRRLGNTPDGPQVAAAATYLALYGERLTRSSTELSRAFQLMMEQKLTTIRLFNRAVLVVGAIVMLTLLALLYRHLVKPLRETMAGFTRVARGDLGHQVPVQGAGEIRQMTTAFNQLSERLNALFRLTDRISHGNTLDDTLRFVLEEFRGFLPLDWVGLLFVAPDGERLILDRQYGE